MRLTYKLAACLVAANCLVLGLYGLLARQREVAMFERATERDTYHAAVTLLAAMEDAWAERGEEAARRLVRKARERRPDVGFRYLALEPRALPDLGPEALDDLRAGLPVHLRAGQQHRLYAPFTPPGEVPGVLEVSQTVGEDEAYARTSVYRLGAASAVSVAVSAALAVLLSAAFVGRPVEALIAKVERIGEGKTTEPVGLTRGDEVGRLGRAIDRMALDLKTAREQAAREASERLATLRQLRHAERLATVGRLASGVAHELGTPLNVVLARAKLIASAADAPPEARDHAEIVREQARRMTRIIRQLLDFARRGESRKVPADLRQLAARTLTVLEPLATRRSVALELDEAPVEARAEVDPEQIEQVLANLIMNAIQASPAGGVVSVSVRPERRTPPPDHGGGQQDVWRVTVRDEGAGIPEDLRQRIFEPFFTTKDVGEGTGLGLPVAHGIVSEHDGWIGVESAVGAGTAFSVYLPTGEVA